MELIECGVLLFDAQNWRMPIEAKSPLHFRAGKRSVSLGLATLKLTNVPQCTS